MSESQTSREAPTPVEEAGKDARSTALAERTPAALTRAPSFYPTGHADQGVLLSVVIGGPVAAAAVFGALPAVLGLGAPLAIGLAIFGAPVGLLGTNWYYEDRGKAGLRRALSLHAHSPEQGQVALAAIAGSRRWLPEVRLEAAARLAIDAFERGDVAAAIQHLDVGEQDQAKLRRRRSWEAGLRGELMRSILAWLSPDSFVDYGVAASEGFTEPEDDEQAAALLAALRVLEGAGQSDDARLAAAWEDQKGTQLSELLPTLFTVVAAVAAERLHHLADALHERLRADDEGRLRTLLRRLFPRMQLLVDEGYRGVSAELPGELERASLDIIAPAELTELARLPESAAAAISRSPVAGIFSLTYGLFLLGGALLAGAGAGLGLGLAAGFFLSIYVGTPIAAVWGGHAIQARERARRVAPLRRLRPRPAEAWLVECASGPPGPVTRSSAYRRLSDLPTSQMVLYVACMKAEHALAMGDLDAAWKRIEWWFAGFSGQLPGRDPMYAVGCCLLRLATLCGRLSEAEALSRVLPEFGNPWDDASRRTAYGNAPRAVALARALLAARRGQWELAAGLLEFASMARPIYMGKHDQALYAELVRRVGESGHPVRWTRWNVDSNWRPWLAKVWPETAALPSRPAD